MKNPLSRNSPGFKLALKVFSILLGVGVTALLIWRLRAEWGKFRELELSLRPWPLAVSGVCFFAGFCALVEGWRRLVRALGFSVPYRDAFRVVVRSSLGRYIPGKVWAAAGLVYLGRGAGVPVKIGGAAAVISTVLLVLTGALVAFYRLGSSLPPLLRLLPAALGVFFLLLALHRRVWGWGERLFSRFGRGSLPACRRRDLLGTLPFYFFFWIGMGVGFVFAVASLVGKFPVASAELVSAYALAYAGGVLAVFVPGGLGVREGLLAFYLSGLLPEPLPLAAGIFSRVWATALEGILFGFTFLPFPRRRAGVDSPSPVPDNSLGLSDRHSSPE